MKGASPVEECQMLTCVDADHLCSMESLASRKNLAQSTIDHETLP